MNTLYKLVKDQNGATAIEYALIAALIALAAVASLQSVNTGMKTTFNSVSSNLTR